MKTSNTLKTTKLLSLLLLMASSRLVLATSSTVVINLDGSTTCSSLSTSAILEAKDTIPPPAGGSKAIIGPDGQRFIYTIGTTNTATPGDTITIWNTTVVGTVKPVNHVILKSAGSTGSRAFFFPSQTGALSDTDEVARGRIAAVSFCYGLAESFTPTNLPTCDPSLCPSDPSVTRLMVQIDEPANANWVVNTCSCGPAFAKCNESSKAGEPDACTNGNGALQYLPAQIDLVRDPDSYICLVLNGTRKCYSK